MKCSVYDLITYIKNSTRTLFVFCGYPYSGKTYIIQNLIKELDIKHVSIDDIFHTHGFNWDTNHLPDASMWQIIFDKSYDIAKKYLLDNQNVLFDSTNQTLESRKILYNLAQSVDAKCITVHIKTSIKTIWKRWEQNTKKHDRSIVSWELVQMTVDMFQEPTPEEGEVYTIFN